MHQAVSDSPAAALELHPPSGMVDSPFHVTVHSLPPGCRVKLSSSLIDERGGEFRCECVYVADRCGAIDTRVHPSVGGTFEGVQPTGLLDHLVSVEPGRRLLKREVTTPWRVAVQLHREGADAVKREAERWYLSPDVTMQEVDAGRLRGRLYIPAAHHGRVPAVIDLFGSLPGCVDFRAALLASHGFLAYALPNYGYRDMPSSFAQVAGLVPDQAAPAGGPPPPPGIDLAYFEEAARWLQRHSRALEGGGVGVFGHSFGGGLALAIAAYLPPRLIGAVVSVNSGSALVVPVRHGTRRVQPEHLAFNPCAARVNADGHGEAQWGYDPPELAAREGKLFPIWASQVPVLLAVGGGDAALPSVAYAECMRGLLRERAPPGRDVTLITYPGAGHLLEPPHAPLARFSRRTAERSGLFQTSVATAEPQLAAWLTDPEALIDWGGRPAAHAAAQRQLWQDAQRFLRTRLRASARAAAAAAAAAGRDGASAGGEVSAKLAPSATCASRPATSKL